MAIAKKGTRLINIDNLKYRWVVQPDDEPGLAIVVELANDPYPTAIEEARCKTASLT